MASSTPSGDAIASSVETVPVDELASLDIKDADAPAAVEVPPHRSHDPANNMKRSDPFQFGSRYLNEGDDVYEFNAWDHVETDDAYKEHAEQQYAKQRQHPVSDFEKSKSFLSSYTTKAAGLVFVMIQHQCIVHLNPMKTNIPSILSLPSETPPCTFLLQASHV